ncbi:hypothetical protein EDD36DRAFT_469336 [Exophiala viscosa]|uniref:Uncharacterized protein n=1 Tax=Exophiala viscosa TaxID=2486360 RepID=A0AAN6DPN7_9EURO|nr:hypothetical protein EDD36DRAFT_469336 [Exophiala viscosa]
MSWMDSWSRPGKRSAVPPPYYLTQGENAAYCQTCGRTMSSRKVQKDQNKVIKYCSDGCRHRKPGPSDRKIERRIVALLNDEPESGIEKTAAKSKLVKGDRRAVVTMDEIEEIVFGSKADESRAEDTDSIGSTAAGVSDISDVESTTANPSHQAAALENLGEPKSRDTSPGLVVSDANDSWDEENETGRVGPPLSESEKLKRRQEGNRRVEHREMVRKAARRLIVFGFLQKAPEGRGDQPKKSEKRSHKAGKAGADDCRT